MFDLLSLALLLAVVIYVIYFLVSKLIPTFTLALLGGVIVIAAPIALLLLPDDETVVTAANIVILFLIGNLLYYLYKGKVPQKSVLWALGVVLLLSLPIVSNFLVRQQEQGALQVANPPRRDESAIVLLGKGTTRPNLRPTQPVGGVSGVQISDNGERILHTLELYRSLDAPLVILSAGRRSPNIVQKVGDKDEAISESTDIRTLLTSLGIPPERIVVEPEDGTFQKSAAGVRKILTDRGLANRIILVSSATDIELASEIFRRAGFTVTAAPTEFHTIYSSNSTRRVQGRVVENIPKLLPSPEALGRSLQLVGQVVEALRDRMRLIFPFLGS